MASLIGQGSNRAGDDILRYQALGPVHGRVHGSVHRAGSWARELVGSLMDPDTPERVCYLSLKKGV